MCFAIRRGEAERLDPKFIIHGGHQALRGVRTATLGSLTLQEPDYGGPYRAVPLEADGFKYIRVTDFDDFGIPKGHEYVGADGFDPGYVLHEGDLLFARSGATAGKTFLYTRDIGPAIFAGYCIRFRFDAARVLPGFVYLYTKTDRYQAWVRSMQRPSGQPNINKEEFKSFTIPLPDPPKQRELLAALDAARAARRRKLEEAESLLGGLDAFVLETLGLTPPPPHDPNKPFAVRLRQVRDRRLDPPAYTPFPIPSNPRRVPIKPLASVAAIDSHTAPPQTDENAIVPYVGLPECDVNDVREVASRTYKEARGRSVAHVGDILFARIEPSVFNKKYVFVEHLGGHDYAFLSTEFYAVRAHGNEDDQKYLYAMFQSAFVFNQVRGKTTGSSGRRRIDPDMFASLLIPWPDGAVRKKIAAEVSRRRDAARRLREEATRLWDDAKRRFEEELLGPAT